MGLLCIGGSYDGRKLDIYHGSSSKTVPVLKSILTTVISDDGVSRFSPKSEEYEQETYVKMTIRGEQNTFTFLKIESLSWDETMEKLINNYNPKAKNNG